MPGDGAWVAVHRFEPGALTMQAVLAHLQAERGVRSVLCEGGPTLLRQLVAAGVVDDLLLTVAPCSPPATRRRPLHGAPLHPAAGLALRDVHRAGDHLFLHYSL